MWPTGDTWFVIWLHEEWRIVSERIFFHTFYLLRTTSNFCLLQCRLHSVTALLTHESFDTIWYGFWEQNNKPVYFSHFIHLVFSQILILTFPKLSFTRNVLRGMTSKECSLPQTICNWEYAAEYFMNEQLRKRPHSQKLKMRANSPLRIAAGYKRVFTDELSEQWSYSNSSLYVHEVNVVFTWDKGPLPTPSYFHHSLSVTAYETTQSMWLMHERR